MGWVHVLAECARLGVRLRVQGERLIVDADRPVPAELVQALAANKQALLRFLPEGVVSLPTEQPAAVEPTDADSPLELLVSVNRQLCNLRAWVLTQGERLVWPSVSLRTGLLIGSQRSWERFARAHIPSVHEDCEQLIRLILAGRVEGPFVIPSE